MMTVFHQIAPLLFWLSIGALVYAYLIYPVVLSMAARIFGRRFESSPLSEESLPFLSVLIAAHNEQGVIPSRIRNALEMDYPADRFEIVVASDGSTDSTANICGQFEDRRVRVLDYPIRRGKAAVLCDAMSELRGAVVLLSDANTFTDRSAAKSLVRWFADEQVGAVCGRLVLQDPPSGKNADGLYWRYETFLKLRESRLGALLGSNGAIYAIRRNLYPRISPSTIVEDFVIPLLARLKNNCRIIYDSAAVACEQSAPDIQSEFRRRVRIGAGDVQAIKALWPLLNPRHGWIAFTFLSHKVLRWLGPLFLLTALVANALLLDARFYQRLGLLQLGGYAMAAVGGVVPRAFPGSRLLRLCNLFVTMNAALLVGYLSVFVGSAGGAWKPTKRSGGEQSLPDDAQIIAAEAAE